MSFFVQLGATRDGLDPYLRAAQARDIQAVLIETPDYLALRQQMGRKEFALTLAVEHPAHVDEVLAALEQLSEKPVLLLAGFERYIYTAYAVAQRLAIPPYRFTPPNKAQQRLLVSRSAGLGLLQPHYVILEGDTVMEEQLAALTYPLIVKPTDGGGGLAVFLAHDFTAVQAALARLRMMSNYDGEDFGGVLIEEYLSGIEHSGQGVVRDGHSCLLTFCRKFVLTEAIEGEAGCYGFRETGHLAMPGGEADAEVQQFVQSCVDCFQYTQGPFHIDMVRSPQGIFLLEMGFRLSGGGIVSLVERVSGYDWAEETFAIHTGTRPPQLAPASPAGYVGQLTVASDQELERARGFLREGFVIDVQTFAQLEKLPVAAGLQSDLARHGGIKGRISVRGPNIQEIEQILQHVSPARAVVLNQE